MRLPSLRRFGRLPKSAWKFAAFGVACLVLLAALAERVGNVSLFSSRQVYFAQLADVTGLSTGTPVDVAGVQVGQVSSIRVQRGHALVGLSIDGNVTLHRGSDVGLRWKNVIGQKDVYLYPSRRGALLRPGDVVPLSHDVSDASVNAFLNSLGPLLQAVSPREANAFVENVSGAINGDTAEIDQLVSSGARIASTVGALNVEVGAVIDSLDQVLTAIAKRSGDVGTLVDNLQRVAQALASHNDLLDAVVGNLATVAGDLATLVGENRQTISSAIDGLDTATSTIVAHQQQLAQSLATLGSGLAPYVEMSSYGQWFQVQTVYNCLANQTVCSYDAPTSPPAGSGPGGSPPLGGPPVAGTPSAATGSPGAAPPGTTAGGGPAGGTSTGGPSSIPAIMHALAGPQASSGGGQ